MSKLIDNLPGLRATRPVEQNSHQVPEQLAVKARPLTSGELTMEAIATAQDAAHAAAASSAALTDWLARIDSPAELLTITLADPATGGKSKCRIPRGNLSASIAVWNATAKPALLGIAGAPAEPNRGAFVVPAGCAVVLPVESSGQGVELGMDPADLAGAAFTLHVLRFAAVQPFSAAKIA